MAIKRGLPTFEADGSAVVLPSRTGSYGEAFVIPLGSGKSHIIADEDSYNIGYNVTDGTGIAGHAAPVQADLSTKPLLHMYNGHATKRLYIDFIRLRMTAIGAGASTTDFTTWVDNNGATVKTSGGTVATIVSALGGGSPDTDTILSFGAVVATAGTGEKRLDHQRVRSVVPVVEDQYVFLFGNLGAYGLPAAMALTGTAVVSAFVHMPPVVVPPRGNFKLVMWGVTQSGAHSHEYTIGYWRR